MTLIAAADARGIARAAELLRAGELVAFPTETVYGLGADARSDAAVRKIFAAKGRPANHPVIVHLREAHDVHAWAAAWPSAAQKLAAAFWPGPLTVIVRRAAGVHDVVTGGQDTVGLRVPVHPVAQALLQAFGDGIAAPSANRFGLISPTAAGHVADDLGDRIALILDGGACPVGIESTIVACVGDEPMLLRPGGISGAALAAVLGHALRGAHSAAPRASGTLASHYAPRTLAVLMGTEALRREAGKRDAAVLAYSVARPERCAGPWISAPADAAGYAQTLYANLRALDASGAAVILIEEPPDDGAWIAVRDRLARATHPGTADLVDDID